MMKVSKLLVIQRAECSRDKDQLSVLFLEARKADEILKTELTG